MARFNLHARNRAGEAITLIYDNQTSELLASDLTPWPLPYVEKAWSAGQIEAISHIHPVSEQNPGRKEQPKVLKIQLGLSCNYSCDYCSQRFVPHASETAPGDVPAFLKLLDESLTQAPQRIEFWGGEPLVYIKTLRPLVESLRDRYPQAAFSIITNGSLLNPEINAWLDAMGFGVGISHDGPGQSARGPDPLEDEVSRTGILDLYQRLAPQGRISFNAMVHRTNTSREAIAKFFLQLTGDASLSIGEGAFVDPYDAGGLAHSLQSSSDAFAFRRQSLDEIRRGRIVHMDVARQRMQEWARSILEKRFAKGLGQKCGMDRPDQLAVDLKGRVLTCQNVSSVAVAPNGQPHHAGNLADLSSVALKTSTHWSKRMECPACPVLQACKGACMFLEGPLWQAACDNAYSDHTPFFVAAVEHLTGCAVYRIEGVDALLPAERMDVFGLAAGPEQEPARRVIPIGIDTRKAPDLGGERQAVGGESA